MVNQDNFKGDFVKNEDIEKLLNNCKFQYFHGDCIWNVTHVKKK